MTHIFKCNIRTWIQNFFQDESLIIRKIFFSRNNKNRSHMGTISERLGFPNHALAPFSSRPAV